jgi:hypothetical protein
VCGFTDLATDAFDWAHQTRRLMLSTSAGGHADDVDASSVGSPHVHLRPPPDTLARGVSVEADLANALPQGALFPMCDIPSRSLSTLQAPLTL